MRIVCNGFIDADAGSLAHASHLVLRELLCRGHEITFVSKKSFIHPKDLLDAYPNLSYVDASNVMTGHIHRATQLVFPPAGHLTSSLQHWRFTQCVMREIRRAHQESPFNAMLFLGDAAFGRVEGLKTVSWVQGPPGTDARSLWDRGDLLRKTEGLLRLSMLRTYGSLRVMKRRTAFNEGGTIVVGSRWSVDTMTGRFGMKPERVTSLAYPVDLAMFSPRPQPPPSDLPLKVLWLGRVVPRKRLDLFLNAAAQAHRDGVPIHLNIAGGFAFTPGLKQLIDTFPYPEILKYVAHVSRAGAALLLKETDVLCQPSDEENFGSSVAEALASGTPTIVGATNGTADYICSRSIHLTDDAPQTLADAFRTCYDRKKIGTLIDVAHTRSVAERNFSVGSITDALEILMGAQKSNRNKPTANSV